LSRRFRNPLYKSFELDAFCYFLEVRSEELPYIIEAADATIRLGLDGGKGAPKAVGILPQVWALGSSDKPIGDSLPDSRILLKGMALQSKDGTK
jgi:hypothetical protein